MHHLLCPLERCPFCHSLVLYTLYSNGQRHALCNSPEGPCLSFILLVEREDARIRELIISSHGLFVKMPDISIEFLQSPQLLQIIAPPAIPPFKD